MRKPKERHDEDGDEAHYFEDLEPDDVSYDDDASSERDARHRRRPARQRVELRNEQQSLRRQLSDWDDYDDYGQDDFETKL